MLLELDRVSGFTEAHLAVKCEPERQSDCEIVIAEGPDAVTQVEPDWRQLAADDGVPTSFQSFAVAAAAAVVHVAKNERPRIVVVRRGDKPVVLFPTVITSCFGQSVVRFLGDPLIQYGDVIASPSATSEDFSQAWAAAANPRVASFALFRRIRDDAHAAAICSQNASFRGKQESPLVHVHRPRQTSAREAREARRLHRRLSERGELEVLFLSGPAAKAALSKALALKRSWLKTRALESSVIGNDDWEDALRRLCLTSAEEGGLMIATLMVGGKMAAAEAAFVDQTCWYAFMGAFAPEFACAGPGQLLSTECISYVRGNGLSIYDQLPPSQAYKQRLATDFMTVHDYSSVLSPRGYIVLGLALASQYFKSLVEHAPVGVRRAILRLYRIIQGKGII